MPAERGAGGDRIYKNLDNYFNDCERCGQCCKLPGIFLPEQVEALREQLDLGMETLFRRYLIAELFTPGCDLPPVFMLSPVKVDEAGKRLPKLFADGEYHRIRHRHCIFWHGAKAACRIYGNKPFGCSVLLCAKMTDSDPLLLRKSYYYQKWLDYQEILFRIFPHMEACMEELRPIAASGRKGVAEMTRALNRSPSLV